jgi:DNA-binding MarR family transcriptional regulator
MARSKGDYELLDDIGFLLARSAGVAIRTANERFGELGLRARSFSVLAYVVRMEGVSQRSLSDFLALDPSQTVALVDDLESQGLIERRQGIGDRRIRELSATRLGRERMKEAAAAAAAAHAQFLTDLEPDERRVLRQILRRIAFPKVDEAQAAS